MTVTSASFRSNLTEFADASRFPESQVTYWLGLAAKLVANTSRWGNLIDDGIQLFIAHNLTLERRAMDEADNGAAPGLSTGMINNKSVDKVSVGYDTTSAMELDAGHWNLTIYGMRYIRLARLIGAGPVQVGTPDCDPSGALGSSGAWPGPWFSGTPNPSG